jgi:hypothetical protein
MTCFVAAISRIRWSAWSIVGVFGLLDHLEKNAAAGGDRGRVL